MRWIIGLIFLALQLEGAEKLPERIGKIMAMDKYKHSTWGLYVKDSETGNVLYDYQSDQLFLPGSTTKIFTVSAWSHAYGDDFRFKTPVYAAGSVHEGILEGSLILVGKGDLTFGGRQNPGSDLIAFTNMDHIYANEIPGASITPQDPLQALNVLAKTIKVKGITQINGDVIIDDSLFEKTEKRGMVLTPILINENLIDLILNPSEVGQKAQVAYRPMVEGYVVQNEVQTVDEGNQPDIQITSEDGGKKIILKGTLPLKQKNVLRVYPIQDPAAFAQAAFTDALKRAGIKINPKKEGAKPLPQKDPIAVWTSPPLSEYGKLILKVSHNLGADLIPLLLAVKDGKHTFDDGMLLFGKFTTDVVKVPADSFVFIDGAGGDQNRLTPHAEVKLLDYVRKLPLDQFNIFQKSLPILGKDGSLADVSLSSSAVGKVFAKPGTGVSYNLASRQFFLTAQALAGYIEGKNGHLLEFMIGVNNGIMPKIEDIFEIFEDFGQITVILYDESAE